MSQLTFSIIIPVYNSEKYLSACVASITGQSYHSYEIILVDDGSREPAATLCDTLAAQNAKIKVMHKPNGGTASARNAGLDVATGDYVTFMDNDDYWSDPEALSKIASQLMESRADVLFHDCVIYWQDTNRYIYPQNRCKRELVQGRLPEQALAHVLSGAVFSTYCVWSKFIKRDLIKRHDIRFPEGMRNEDTCFCGDLFLKARSYDYCENSFYVYRKGHTEAQTAKAVQYRHVCDLQKVCFDFCKKNETEALNDTLKDVLYSYIAFPYCVLMGQLYMVRDPLVKENKKMIKNYRYLLQHRLHPNVKLIATVCRFLGFALTSRLLAIYMKKHNHLT